MTHLSVDFFAYLIYLYIDIIYIYIYIYVCMYVCMYVCIVFLAGYHGLVGNPQHDRRKVELM